MRIMIAAALLAASASVGLADDRTATASTAALQTAAPQSVPQQTPAATTTLEQSFYGFSAGCKRGAQKSDTAKLLMN